MPKSPRKVSFMADIDGIGKFFDSYAIDIEDAKAQISEIYQGEVTIYLFQYKD